LNSNQVIAERFRQCSSELLCVGGWDGLSFVVLGLFSVARGVRVVDHVHGQDLTLVTGCAVEEEDREDMWHLKIAKEHQNNLLVDISIFNFHWKI
jgi:hypothetical protein